MSSLVLGIFPSCKRNGKSRIRWNNPRTNLTLFELERHPLLRNHYPAVADAAHSISSPPLKTMGTLGGNLCVDTRCFYYDQTTNGVSRFTSV